MHRQRLLRIMANYWLFMMFSCVGSVRLQYINTGGPAADSVLNPLDSPLYHPLPYNNYYHPPTNNYEADAIGPEIPNAYFNGQGQNLEDTLPSFIRDRRTTKDENFTDANESRTKETITVNSHVKQDETQRRGLPAKRTVFLQELAEMLNHADGNSMLRLQEKKSFSPWGGKRKDASLGTNIEHAYLWKRSDSDPTMPKRVRFSPWGGKRNGQVLYKQGPKNSRIIFSTTVPIRIMTNYLPYEGINLAGFHVIPMLDKRQPIKILALGSNQDTQVVLPEGLPFKSFLQVIPKMFKPGRPFVDVNIKKDGKRKVKFSAWGGKRSPPIIGPIWTPASTDAKDATLNALVLIRNSQNYKKNDVASI